ncbi:MAG: hypothetical protein F4233_10880, partial [Rhodospirillaceae bacterium]|nr:hypothetical protein [Rhodospirillaceae bacterium]
MGYGIDHVRLCRSSFAPVWPSRISSVGIVGPVGSGSSCGLRLCLPDSKVRDAGGPVACGRTSKSRFACFPPMTALPTSPQAQRRQQREDRLKGVPAARKTTGDFRGPAAGPAREPVASPTIRNAVDGRRRRPVVGPGRATLWWRGRASRQAIRRPQADRKGRAMVRLLETDVRTRDVLGWKGVHLFHFHSSSCSQKTRIVLNLKGVDWQAHPIDLPGGENLSERYLGINPRGLVPTLVIDGEIHIESNDIVSLIDRRFPVPRLIPEGREAEMAELLRHEDDLHLDLRTITFRYTQPRPR